MLTIFKKNLFIDKLNFKDINSVFLFLFLGIYFFASISISFASIDIYNSVSYGRFHSKKGDSVKLIKRQLLYSATLDLMNKTFDYLHLDKKSFWEKFNKKKEEARLIKLNNLIEKFKDNPAKYKDQLRLANFKFDRTYGRLSRLIIKYSIIKRSRSIENSNTYLIKISGYIDKSKISKLYNYYLYEFAKNSTLNIYLSLHLDNKKFIWQELETDKKIVLNTLFINFQSYLNQLFSKTLNKVILIDRVDYITNNIHDGIFIQLDYNIEKIKENQSKKHKIFSVKYAMAIINNSSQNVMISEARKIREYKFFYSTDEKKKKSLSDLVTTFYQFPLSGISNIKNKFYKTIPKKEVSMIVSGYHNMAQIFELNKILEKILVTKQARLKIEKISSNQIHQKIISIVGINDIKQMLQKLIINKDKDKEKYKNTIIEIKNGILYIVL